MCGIAGWIKKGKIEKKVLENMTRVLSHRGPDGEGFYMNENPSFSVGLGHRRLKIIDLVTGDQPMSNEDGSIWLVYNGEVYNFKELREELTKKGHRFSSRSDTEVIIHLYEEEGENLLPRLNGMFAFALWDEKKKKLLIARDRLGIKPLYYYVGEKEFAFASEIKSFLHLPSFNREIKGEAIHYYLFLQYIPSPHTIFKKVWKLPPAHYLVWEDGKIRVEKYWEVEYRDYPDKGEKYYRERLRELLEDAVKIRLVSDVPFGAFLSGGIDSTIVVGVMADYLKEPVRTFSMGFDVASFNELHYAKVASETFQTEHHEFRVKPPNVLELLPILIWHYDEPFADPSSIPTYMVSQLARRYVTMVLSGDGGDEVFAGYHRYLAERLLSLFRPFFLPFHFSPFLSFINSLPESTRINDLSRRLKRLLNRMDLPSAERYISWLLIFDLERIGWLYTSEFEEEVKEIYPPDFLKKYFEKSLSLSTLGRCQYTDLKTYLPEDILTKVDRASMANSLECRVPFLDHRVVEFMASVPPHYKLRGFLLKYLLKKTFKDKLPPKIYFRGKHGFGVPIGKWFREELYAFTEKILLEKRTISRGYFKRKGIERLLEEHKRGRFDHSHRLWTLLMLELWHRFYIDQRLSNLTPSISVYSL